MADTALTTSELPQTVKLAPGSLNLTPNEMREVRELAGVPLADLLDDANPEAAPERAQMVAFITMRRRGTPVTWERAGDMLAELEQEQSPADPTGNGTSRPSPPSVTSGG